MSQNSRWRGVRDGIDVEVNNGQVTIELSTVHAGVVLGALEEYIDGRKEKGVSENKKGEIAYDVRVRVLGSFAPGGEDAVLRISTREELGIIQSALQEVSVSDQSIKSLIEDVEKSLSASQLPRERWRGACQ